MWSLVLGVQSGFDVPIYVIVAFMQTDQFNQQPQKNDSFLKEQV